MARGDYEKCEADESQRPATKERRGRDCRGVPARRPWQRVAIEAGGYRGASYGMFTRIDVVEPPYGTIVDACA